MLPTSNSIVGSREGDKVRRKRPAWVGMPPVSQKRTLARVACLGMVRQPYVPCYHATYDKMGDLGECVVVAVLLGLLGLGCIGYGVTVMTLNSGTLFFTVWYALGAGLLGAALALRTGAWRLVPTVVLKVGGVLVGAIALVLVVAQSLALSQIGAQGYPDLDYVVVLGAQIYDDGSPSPVLRYRLDAALAYLRDNPRTRVVVSGGQGPNEPYPEAEGMAAYLQERGIDSERILKESKSVNTLQNVTFSQKLMDVPNPRVGIITNNFHVYRAVRIARKVGLHDVCGIASYSTPWYLPNNLLREGMGLIKDFLAGNI